MTRRTRTLSVAVVAALAVVASACSSSSKSGGSAGTASTNGATGSTKTITIGVLTDVTGPAASGNKTSVEGVKAGAVYALRNGYKIKYVVGDSTSSPAAVLAAAQRLVTQDHVSAVIAVSALTLLASNYLTAHGVPVIGAGEDGPEWTTSKNMFSVFGALHSTKVADTYGKFFKLEGVNTVGAIGYSISPLSAEAAKAAAASAKAVGLKVGYLNASFPFGSTNVQPVALAMKSAGVNGITTSTDPNTAFALITALRQADANVKVALLPSGYGGDVQQAGAGALQAAQNVYFALGFEPAEMQTAATKQFVSDLRAAGVQGDPTFAEYNGYVSVGLLVRGLKAAAPNTSQTALISALSTIHDWNALGLLGSHSVDINDRTNVIAGADNCLWVTKLVGSTFQVVAGAAPICGSQVPGVTVAPSS